jgi:hypothetical protein
MGVIREQALKLEKQTSSYCGIIPQKYDFILVEKWLFSCSDFLVFR